MRQSAGRLLGSIVLLLLLPSPRAGAEGGEPTPAEVPEVPLLREIRACGLLDPEKAAAPFQEVVRLIVSSIQTNRISNPDLTYAGASLAGALRGNALALETCWKLEDAAERLRAIGEGDASKKPTADLYLAISYLFQGRIRQRTERFTAPISAWQDIYHEVPPRRRAIAAWGLSKTAEDLVFLELAEAYLERAESRQSNLTCLAEIHSHIALDMQDALRAFATFESRRTQPKN